MGKKKEKKEKKDKKDKVVPKKLLKAFSTDTLAAMAADLMDGRNEADQKDWDRLFNPAFAEIMDLGAERLGNQEFSSKVTAIVAAKRKKAG
jgi:hypothetical protein